MRVFKGVYFWYDCELSLNLVCTLAVCVCVCACYHETCTPHFVYVSGFWMKNGATLHKCRAILCTGAWYARDYCSQFTIPLTIQPSYYVDYYALGLCVPLSLNLSISLCVGVYVFVRDMSACELLLLACFAALTRDSCRSFLANISSGVSFNTRTRYSSVLYYICMSDMNRLWRITNIKSNEPLIRILSLSPFGFTAWWLFCSILYARYTFQTSLPITTTTTTEAPLSSRKYLSVDNNFLGVLVSEFSCCSHWHEYGLNMIWYSMKKKWMANGNWHPRTALTADSALECVRTNHWYRVPSRKRC